MDHTGQGALLGRLIRDIRLASSRKRVLQEDPYPLNPLRTLLE
jgi:hypothetical protein